MVHFGIICPATDGHLNSMTALGYELKQRGHFVTVLGIADAQSRVLAAELEFQMIGNSDFPLGETKRIHAHLGKLSGLEALQYTIQCCAKEANMYLRDAPEVVKAVGIEVLLVDQSASEGGTVAEYLNIPFLSFAIALMFNREPSVPPFTTSWSYDPSQKGILRNKEGYYQLDLVGEILMKTINSYRYQWNLPLHTHPNQRHSSLAQISQQPAEFEFPRKQLPKCFYFTGSFSSSINRKSISFPYEQLTGQPLIYASMGTLQNRLFWIFEMIAEACANMNVQLLITLGSEAANLDSLSKFSKNTIVVDYAPQLELLQLASLTVTHAGLNTTLESLSNGVPIVAIPIANDQPGVGARIAWTGTGEVVPLDNISVKKLRTVIRKVLTDGSYKQKAIYFQRVMEESSGANEAANIIEQILLS